MPETEARQPTSYVSIGYRGKRSICVSAKSKAGREVITKLIERSDVLIDPFRPGVLEKLGLGPDEMLKLNPKLVYARMYGFEKDSKYANMAGHDINYSALSGVLSVGTVGSGKRAHTAETCKPI